MQRALAGVDVEHGVEPLGQVGEEAAVDGLREGVARVRALRGAVLHRDRLPPVHLHLPGGEGGAKGHRRELHQPSGQVQLLRVVHL